MDDQIIRPGRVGLPWDNHYRLDTEVEYLHRRFQTE